MEIPSLNGREKEMNIKNRKKQHSKEEMTNVTFYPILEISETNIVHVKQIKDDSRP